MRRAIFRVAVVATAGALIGALSVAAGAAESPTVTIGIDLSGSGSTVQFGSEPSVQFGRLNYTVDTADSDQTQADRWPFEVLQRGYAGQLSAIRAAETTTAPMTFLFYADPMIIRPSDPAGYTTALTPAEVQQDHPSWLLRDTTGKVISRSDGNGDEMMDPGNVDYQNAAAANLIDIANTEGWNGVLLDEVNEFWQWTMAAQPANYANQQDWDNAQLAFVHNVCGQVIKAGKLCLTNTGDAATDMLFWSGVTGDNSGSMQEFYVALNSSLGGAPQVATVENGWWQPSEDRLIDSQDAGKNSLFRAYAVNTAEVRYALGSYLLAWQGYGTFAASTDYYGDTDSWSSDFTAAQSFGRPTEDQQAAGDLLWRQFEHGYVVVNPHSTQQSATVNGKTVTLAAGTAELVATS
ncbi:MAG TPA: putative glycoside hydrolase [Pseudonocardiaceae bacterium]|nr:putative glycoside hydrolase [Pseudonocardiaceae bacterium]